MTIEEGQITVEDTFLISGRGLIVAPMINPPATDGFRSFTNSLTVVRPDGNEMSLLGRFELSHSRGTDGRSDWCIVLVFPEATKTDVPIGSRVLLSDLARAAFAGVTLRDSPRPMQYNEIVARLGSDEIHLSIWVRPHRSWGYVKTVILGDGGAIVLAQSFSEITGQQAFADGVDTSHAHINTFVELSKLAEIVDRLKEVVIPLVPKVSPPVILGGSHFGLCFEYCDVVTQRRWHGRVEDVEPEITQLWTLVDSLVGNP